jgi:Na+-transporting NADH:ubiquinone oxidoreductase subunit C
MAFTNGYIFGFASVVCVACSLAVASTSLVLRDKQDLNKQRDLQSSILTALQLPEDGSKLYGEAIDEVWGQRVEALIVDADGKPVSDRDLDGDGDTDSDDVKFAWQAVKGQEDADGSQKTAEILEVFRRIDNGGTTGAYAIPMAGVGLWGPVSGYLAIKSNGSDVIGATFFGPKETPGLGAEIMNEPFEKQWQGKQVLQAINVVKPGNACPTKPEFCVDGVSGATITSRGVDAMVEVSIEKHYAKYLARIRSGS